MNRARHQGKFRSLLYKISNSVTWGSWNDYNNKVAMDEAVTKAVTLAKTKESYKILHDEIRGGAELDEAKLDSAMTIVRSAAPNPDEVVISIDDSSMHLDSTFRLPAHDGLSSPPLLLDSNPGPSRGSVMFDGYNCDATEETVNDPMGLVPLGSGSIVVTEAELGPSTSGTVVVRGRGHTGAHGHK